MGIETSGVALSWPAGTAETGYLVLRSAGGSTVVAASLGASATSYLDTSFRFGPACYMLVGLSGFPPLASAFSPQLCTIPGFSSTSGAPGSFTLRLTSATAAVLTWQAPPGVTPDGYLLIPLGGEPVVLAANATSSAQPVSGTACFWLLVLKGGAVSGQTDLACTIT
jgi:hypothetical protein